MTKSQRQFRQERINPIKDFKLGDVLDKIKGIKGLYDFNGDAVLSDCGIGLSAVEVAVYNWGAVGFTLSLQEILDQTKWAEAKPCDCGGIVSPFHSDDCGECEEFMLNSNYERFWSFFLSIDPPLLSDCYRTLEGYVWGASDEPLNPTP